MSLGELRKLEQSYREANESDASSDCMLDFQDDFTNAFPALVDDINYLVSLATTTNEICTVLVQNGKVFSFRAECVYDVDVLRHRLIHERKPFTMDVQPMLLIDSGGREMALPDCKAEIVIDMSLQQLRDFMYQQQDSHVMTQSLRQCPLNENSLDRDYAY